MIETVINAGRKLCNISFMPENIELLDELAKGHGVPDVPDVRVVPSLPIFIGIELKKKIVIALEKLADNDILYEHVMKEQG